MAGGAGLEPDNGGIAPNHSHWKLPPTGENYGDI